MLQNGEIFFNNIRTYEVKNPNKTPKLPLRGGPAAAFLILSNRGL